MKLAVLFSLFSVASARLLLSQALKSDDHPGTPASAAAGACDRAAGGDQYERIVTVPPPAGTHDVPPTAAEKAAAVAQAAAAAQPKSIFAFKVGTGFGYCSDCHSITKEFKEDPANEFCTCIINDKENNGQTSCIKYGGDTRRHDVDQMANRVEFGQ